MGRTSGSNTTFCWPGTARPAASFPRKEGEPDPSTFAATSYSVCSAGLSESTDVDAGWSVLLPEAKSIVRTGDTSVWVGLSCRSRSTWTACSEEGTLQARKDCTSGRSASKSSRGSSGSKEGGPAGCTFSDAPFFAPNQLHKLRSNVLPSPRTGRQSRPTRPPPVALLTSSFYTREKTSLRLHTIWKSPKSDKSIQEMAENYNPYNYVFLRFPG